MTDTIQVTTDTDKPSPPIITNVNSTGKTRNKKEVCSLLLEINALSPASKICKDLISNSHVIASSQLLINITTLCCLTCKLDTCKRLKQSRVLSWQSDAISYGFAWKFERYFT